ncbi:MAG: hypothetical protein J6A79_00880, partial [Clostridia bacterium]|nr:hypothetical protein [Clostridia bacterium]
LPYRYCLNGQYKPNKAKNIVMFFVMLVLGFIVGESAPNVSVGVLFAVIAFITLQRINKKPVFPWMYGVGNFAGLIFILTAPGQHARAMATGESAISLKPISLLKHLILISSDLFRNYWMILILLAFFIYWIVRKWVENNHKASDILMASFAEIPEFWFYVFFFLAATFSMIVVSGFPARVWCSPTAGLIILTIVLVNYLVEHEMIANVKVTIVSCLIVLCALVIYPSAYTDVNSTFYYATKRDEYIQIQVEEGKSEIRAAPICSSSRYACFRAGGDLGADPNVWPNTSIARYYNVEALIGDISISYD